MTESRKETLRLQIRQSRVRILRQNPTLALVLMYLKYVATKDVWRISTNGHCIYFNPDWFSKLSNREKDFMLSHEALHIVFGDIDRPVLFKGERYHLACDIIANSCLRESGWYDEKLAHIGTIFHETFYPTCEGSGLSVLEAFKGVPFDPATLPETKRRSYMIDSDLWWERKADGGESGEVILNPGFESGDPNPSEEGDCSLSKRKGQLKIDPTGQDSEEEDDSEGGGKQRPLQADAVGDIIQMLREEKKRDNYLGDLPPYEERILGNSRASKLNWRDLLDGFMQEEICDYSFTPPDRRFGEGDFFLPDFSEKTAVLKEVLFMIDTSASVTNDVLGQAYEEISTVIDQFSGKIQGRLGFFDTDVYTPIPFETVGDIGKIRPRGGGGTDFKAIFKYIKESGSMPSSIVIITDGLSEYPEQEETMNIPVLWLLSKRRIGAYNPPWGQVAVIE